MKPSKDEWTLLAMGITIGIAITLVTMSVRYGKLLSSGPKMTEAVRACEQHLPRTQRCKIVWEAVVDEQ